MSTTNLQFTLTQAGQNASFNNGAIDLAVTHVQLGSGNRTPTGTEIALVTPREFATIGGAIQISPGQWRISTIIPGTALNYSVTEIGLWAGAPGAGGSTLVFYWSQATGNTGVKSPNVDFNVEIDMAFGGIVPANITIVADTQFNALSMIAQHNLDVNAHNSLAKLHAANGYQRIAGGLILQWVSGTPQNTEGDYTVTFPIAFPNNVFKVIVSTRIANPSTGANQMWQLRTQSLTAATIYLQLLNPTVDLTLLTPDLIAIGN